MTGFHPLYGLRDYSGVFRSGFSPASLFSMNPVTGSMTLSIFFDYKLSVFIETTHRELQLYVMEQMANFVLVWLHCNTY